ncbi:hypothetical protein Dimus_020081, partial [Dionaea muscipula]
RVAEVGIHELGFLDSLLELGVLPCAAHLAEGGKPSISSALSGFLSVLGVGREERCSASPSCMACGLHARPFVGGEWKAELGVFSMHGMLAELGLLVESARLIPRAEQRLHAGAAIELIHESRGLSSAYLPYMAYC